MMKKNYIFFFLLLFCLTGFLYPQFRFRMIGGDRLRKMTDGRHFIENNVHLSYGFYGIKCDSAFTDASYERAWLYGNINLWDTLRVVQCNRADIFKKDGKSKAYLYGNVKIDQDSIKIYGDEARFNQQFKNTVVEGSVKVEYYNYPSLLKGQYLKDDMENNEIQVRRMESVQAVDSIYKFKLFTDELFYNTARSVLKLNLPFSLLVSELAQKIPNIDSIKYQALDSLMMIPDRENGNKTTLKASKGFYDIGKEQLDLYRNCAISMVDSVGKTTTLLADTILFDIKKNIVKFHSNVYFSKDTLSGKCGYAEFLIDCRELKLFKEPIMNMGRDFAKGDKIKILFDEKSTTPRKITIDGSSYMESISDPAFPRERNSIKGNLLEMYFSGKKLRKIKVSGQATSVYFVKENNKKGKPASASNFITGDTLSIILNNDGMESISIKGGSKGTYYPDKMKFKALK